MSIEIIIKMNYTPKITRYKLALCKKFYFQGSSTCHKFHVFIGLV